MAALQPLLKPVVGFAVSQVLGTAAASAADAVRKWFRDNSALAPKAVAAAGERAWQAVGVALGGDGVLDRVGAWFTRGDDKACRAQIREFLAVAPLPDEMTRDDFRRKCLGQWKRARPAALGDNWAADDVADDAAGWQRFTDPHALVRGAAQAVARVADSLPEYPELARLLRQPTPAGPPVLAAAFAYFFRREVEGNAELARGLTLDALNHLAAAQVEKFDALANALDTLGAKTDQLLVEVGELFALSLDTHAEVGRLREMNVDGFAAVHRIEEGLTALLARQATVNPEVRPGLSFSIRNEGERRDLKALLEEYRRLPDGTRAYLPGILNKLGLAHVAVGDFKSASQAFGEVVELVTDPAGQAQAHYNAYRTFLEREEFDPALDAIRRAAALAPSRFRPFPMNRYLPQRILGAGGFGTVFLCEDKNSDREPVAIKALHADDLDRSTRDIFREAIVLRGLNHPAVIGIVHFDYADTDAELRPYIIMPFFDGQTLHKLVERSGVLPAEVFLPIAAQIADGMSAAHAKNILHRDLKPENVLVAPGPGGVWRVKVIDFGLALQRSAVETRSMSQDKSRQGASVAGTIQYAPPEQLGRLPGVEPGFYSDVFSFGKLCSYCLFKRTVPLGREWKQLHASHPAFADLLEQCLEEDLEPRLKSFDPLLDALADHLPDRRAEKQRRDEIAEQKRRAEEEVERRRIADEQAEQRRRELERLAEEMRQDQEREQKRVADALRAQVDRLTAEREQSRRRDEDMKRQLDAERRKAEEERKKADEARKKAAATIPPPLATPPVVATKSATGNSRAVTVICPSCQTHLRFLGDGSTERKQVDCPKCRFRFAVQHPPDDDRLPPDPPPAPPAGKKVSADAAAAHLAAVTQRVGAGHRDRSTEAVLTNPVFAENVLSFPVVYGLALQGLQLGRMTANLTPFKKGGGFFSRLWSGAAPKAAWGIDVGQSAIKALRLERESGPPIATAFDYVEYPKILSEPDADPDKLIRDALEQFLSRNALRGDAVAVGIPGQAGLVRFIKLPPVEERKIAEIIKFEAKQQIPFPLEEVVWDFQKVAGGEVVDGFAMETEFGLFAMKKDMLKRATDPFTACRIEPAVVQMNPLALVNYAAYDLLGSTPSPGVCLALLDIGTDSANFIITDGGRIVWLRPIPLGGNNFTRAMMKEMKLTFAKAEHLKRNATKSPDLAQILKALKPVLADFVGEVQRSLGYFTNTHKDAHIARLVGVGGGFRLPGLQKYLSEKLQIEVVKPTDFQRLGRG